MAGCLPICVRDSYYEALDIIENLSTEDPDVIAYHIALGDTQVLLGRHEDAMKTFENALKLFPRNVPLVIAYGERLLELNQAEKAHTFCWIF